MLLLGLQANDGSYNCRAVSKESQNRYSKSAKDWGWREFLQLHTLFDQEAGFLVSDSVVFAAEVLVLKEVSEVKQVRHQIMSLSCECCLRSLAGLSPACDHVGPAASSFLHIPHMEHQQPPCWPCRHAWFQVMCPVLGAGCQHARGC